MERLAWSAAAEPVKGRLWGRCLLACLLVKVGALLPVICGSGAQLRQGRILFARDWTTLVLAFDSRDGKCDLFGAAHQAVPSAARGRAAPPGHGTESGATLFRRTSE
jgi:hypothetical protein